MQSIIGHVSPGSTGRRLLSPKQFELLVSTEGRGLGRSAASTLDVSVMYSSLYVSFLDLCETCEPSSAWTAASNVRFVTLADDFMSKLEVCIHKVPRSKVLRDAITLVIGVGSSPGGTDDEDEDDASPQDWDKIMTARFFDFVAYRASCVGNEIIGLTDETYHGLNAPGRPDYLASARTALLPRLSDMSNSPAFARDLRLALTCFSVARRVRSIFRRRGGPVRGDTVRVVEAVVGEWVCGQA